MTAPIFQPSGGQPTRTGTCPVCGREDVPIHARRLHAHTELRVKGRAPGGLPLYVDSDTTCAGSGGPAEDGSETRPSLIKGRRGNTMPAAHRNQILRRDGAA